MPVFCRVLFGACSTQLEDNLQKAAYKLNQIITEYGLTISVQKTKSVAFKGRDPVRTEIVIDNKIIEQVNSFNYLGNISYEKELDIDNNLHNYLKITGVINNVFRPQKKPLRKQEYNYTIHWPSQCCYMAVKHGLLKQGMPGE
jgi:hypothetical protein